ncbi:MAG: hypothetical protein WBW81_15325, partial [Methylocella sp.]
LQRLKSWQKYIMESTLCMGSQPSGRDFGSCDHVEGVEDARVGVSEVRGGGPKRLPGGQVLALDQNKWSAFRFLALFTAKG